MSCKHPLKRGALFSLNVVKWSSLLYTPQAYFSFAEQNFTAKLLLPFDSNEPEKDIAQTWTDFHAKGSKSLIWTFTTLLLSSFNMTLISGQYSISIWRQLPQGATKQFGVLSWTATIVSKFLSPAEIAIPIVMYSAQEPCIPSQFTPL